MRFFLCVLSIFSSFTSLSQEIEYKIYFIEDSIKIGDSITLISTLKYPETIEIVQPDSSYNFGQFDFIGKKVFPSIKNANSIYDSAIYFLRTFEIDSIQKIELNSIILNRNDSLNISSNEEYINLVYQVENITSTTKENTVLRTIKSIFNSEKLLIYLIVISFLLISLYLIFRKRIKKYFRVRRLKKDTEEFNQEFSYLLKKYELNNDINDLESVLLLWKRFMDKLTDKAYLSLTTNEISPLIKNKNLIKTLQEIDKNLYSNNKEIIKSNKLKDLKIEANNTSNKEVKRIENGK